MSALLKKLNFEIPVMAAPLGGGPTTPELVAAVSNAGGFGSLAAAYLQPEQITEAVARTRALTSRPFGINLFTPMPRIEVSPAETERALEAGAPVRAELRLPRPTLQPPFHPDFDRQFDAVLRAKPAAFSFIFGVLEGRYVRACQDAGIAVLGTATSRNEAVALEDSGVDAIVAQGAEAGGHHGMFSPAAADPNVPTVDLIRRVCAEAKIPVIAAGGIMNGADIARALAAGAQAAMLGTAFLLCPEAATTAPYREALARKDSTTRLTRAFSGRWARGIENRFIKETDPNSILPFPAQNALTRDIRNGSCKQGRADFMSLWAGTGFANVRRLSAAELVAVLAIELADAQAGVTW